MTDENDELKKAIVKKLTELEKLDDGELPDYILVMVNNRRSREDMRNDLQLFLGDDTRPFIDWLFEYTNPRNRHRNQGGGGGRRDDYRRDRREDLEEGELSRRDEYRPNRRGYSPQRRRGYSPPRRHSPPRGEGNRGFRALADRKPPSPQRKKSESPPPAPVAPEYKPATEEKSKDKKNDFTFSSSEDEDAPVRDTRTAEEKEKDAKIERAKKAREMTEEEKKFFDEQNKKNIAAAKAGTLKGALGSVVAQRNTTITDDNLRRAQIAKREGIIPHHAFKPIGRRDDYRDRDRGPPRDDYRSRRSPPRRDDRGGGGGGGRGGYNDRRGGGRGGGGRGGGGRDDVFDNKFNPHIAKVNVTAPDKGGLSKGLSIGSFPHANWSAADQKSEPTRDSGPPPRRDDRHRDDRRDRDGGGRGGHPPRRSPPRRHNSPPPRRAASPPLRRRSPPRAYQDDKQDEKRSREQAPSKSRDRHSHRDDDRKHDDHYRERKHDDRKHDDRKHDDRKHDDRKHDDRKHDDRKHDDRKHEKDDRREKHERSRERSSRDEKHIKSEARDDHRESKHRDDKYDDRDGRDRKHKRSRDRDESHIKQEAYEEKSESSRRHKHKKHSSHDQYEEEDPSPRKRAKRERSEYEDEPMDLRSQISEKKKKKKAKSASREEEAYRQQQEILELEKQMKKDNKKAKKEKKEKKKLKKAKKEAIPDGGSSSTPDHKYRIKIHPKSKNGDAEPDSTTGPDGKPLALNRNQNKNLIKLIKEAVGEQTRIEEDPSGEISVFVNSNQQMSKKQVKAILKNVMAGRPAIDPVLAKKIKKKSKKKNIEEQIKLEYAKLKESKKSQRIVTQKDLSPLNQDNTVSSSSDVVKAPRFVVTMNEVNAAIKTTAPVPPVVPVVPAVVPKEVKAKVVAVDKTPASLKPFKPSAVKPTRKVSVQPTPVRTIVTPLIDDGPRLQPKVAKVMSQQPVKLDVNSLDRDGPSKKEMKRKAMMLHASASQVSNIAVNVHSDSSSDDSDSSSDSDSDLSSDSENQYSIQTDKPTQSAVVSSTTNDDFPNHHPVVASSHPHTTQFTRTLNAHHASSNQSMLTQFMQGANSAQQVTEQVEEMFLTEGVAGSEDTFEELTKVKKLVNDPTKISSVKIPEMAPQAMSTKDQKKTITQMASDALLLKHQSLNESYQNAIYDPDADKKSIIVTNVHFLTAEIELRRHFEVIGAITRVTIVKDKFTGQPRGLAYIQFSDAGNVELAKALDQTNFNGRPITVQPKFRPKGTNTFTPGGPGARGGGRGGAAAVAARGSYNRTWVRKPVTAQQPAANGGMKVPTD